MSFVEKPQKKKILNLNQEISAIVINKADDLIGKTTLRTSQRFVTFPTKEHVNPVVPCCILITHEDNRSVDYCT
jgi:hypothetical protein